MGTEELVVKTKHERDIFENRSTNWLLSYTLRRKLFPQISNGNEKLGHATILVKFWIDEGGVNKWRHTYITLY